MTSSESAVDDGSDVEELRRERDQALAHARHLEHELGALRGRVKRLELVVHRTIARRQRMAARIARLRRALRVLDR